jgi:glucoamylase
MPLCWAHAEYLSLLRSRKDGVVFDCIPAVQKRYCHNKQEGPCEFWTFAHQPASIATGKVLRIVTTAPAMVHWSLDGWQAVNDNETAETSLGCWFLDLPTDQLPSGSDVVFTFRWAEGWQGRDFRVRIGS